MSTPVSGGPSPRRPCEPIDPVDRASIVFVARERRALGSNHDGLVLAAASELDSPARRRLGRRRDGISGATQAGAWGFGQALSGCLVRRVVTGGVTCHQTIKREGSRSRRACVDCDAMRASRPGRARRGQPGRRKQQARYEPHKCASPSTDRGHHADCFRETRPRRSNQEQQSEACGLGTESVQTTSLMYRGTSMIASVILEPGSVDEESRACSFGGGL